MQKINLSFDYDESVESVKSSINYFYDFTKNNIGRNFITEFICGSDSSNGDVLVFFKIEELPKDKISGYVSNFIFYVKNSWEKTGFIIVEDRLSEKGESSEVDFTSHLFRLRKSKVKCECSLCEYSSYGWCCNDEIIKQFDNVTLIKNVIVASSSYNCLKYCERSDAHDVE